MSAREAIALGVALVLLQFLWPALLTKLLNALGTAVTIALGVAFIACVGVVLVVRSLLRRRAMATVFAEAEVRVDDGVIVVDGKSAIPVRALDEGLIVPDAGGSGASVLLRSSRGSAPELRMSRIEDARALLADLGLSALECPATFSFFFGLRVTVGADGVVIAVPLVGKRRFIPHRRIREVRATSATPADQRIELLLDDGTKCTIETNPLGGSDDAHRALFLRLRDARDAYARAGGTDASALLARGERTMKAWIRSLRSTSNAAVGHYRTASLLPETLWRIALDPSEEEDLRIGAGLALRVGLDDEGKARLKSAAVAAASPRVRVALEAAASEIEDDALEALLVQDDAAKRARRS